MAEIVWTEPALDDLEEITNYIALDKLSAGSCSKDLWSCRITRPVAQCRKETTEFSRSKYKEVIFSPCRIFYRFIGDTVYVLHVMRAEREMRKYMLQDRILKGR